MVSLVSDRAKARIKLAQTGLDGLSLPDVFPRSHDLAKRSALAVFSRLRHAQQALTHARQRLATWSASSPGSAQAQQTQALVEASEAEVQRWQGVGSASRHGLGNLSLIRPPWRLVDSTRQTSHDVERRLPAAVEGLAALVETQGVAVKKTALAKVRKQLAGVSALVDLWGQTGWHAVEHRALPPRWQHGVDAVLLPLMYWQEHRSHTRCPRQKAALFQAWRAVQEAFARQPCPQRLAPEILADWKAWAAEHARAFQRASSAVAGRNGYVSQRQHNHRGLPKRCYQVWTVLDNFACRAPDGTTPAARFFRRGLPALFASVLSQIDALPLPRQRNQALALSA